MACGLPVIATDTSGAVDILTDGELSGGIIVAGNNSDALVIEIGRLLVDEVLRQNLSECARNQIETRFSIENILRVLIDNNNNFVSYH